MRAKTPASNLYLLGRISTNRCHLAPANLLFLEETLLLCCPNTRDLLLGVPGTPKTRSTPVKFPFSHLSWWLISWQKKFSKKKYLLTLPPVSLLLLEQLLHGELGENPEKTYVELQAMFDSQRNQAMSDSQNNQLVIIQTGTPMHS